MGWTTIPVKQATKERLSDLSEKDGRDWDTFLRRELLGEDIDGDPEEPGLPPGFVQIAEASDEQLTEIRERLKQLPELTAQELEERFR